MKEIVYPYNIRTDDEIRQMIRAIELAIEETPSVDCWGNSNARDIREMKQEVKELKSFLFKGKCDKWSETRFWLEGNKGAVFQQDYAYYLERV